MKDKICLVTGANEGIGKETARQLAAKGASLILLCRNREKAEAAAIEISKSTGHLPELLICDLASQADIRKAAKEFNEKYPRLDVLVNNAGAFFSDLKKSPDGIEMQFAVNHLSAFLLTHLLLPKLKLANKARIIVTSSMGHYKSKIHFDDLYFEKAGYNGLTAYKQTKMANVLFTYELARRLEGSGITANTLHPGVVKTAIAQKESHGFFRWLWTVAKPFMTSLEKGAFTTVYLAASPDAEKFNGKYFTKSKPVTSDPLSYDEEVAKKLWKLSEEMTGIQNFRNS